MTIYQPSYLSHRNTSIDMSVNQNFTCKVNGAKITDYQLIIYKNSDNSILYDSTKTALGTPKYNSDTLSILVSGGTIANGLELKYTIKYWNGSEAAISNEILFMSASTATLTISVPNPIATQSYEFVGTYTQAENVGLKEWYYVLYDNNGKEIKSPTSYSVNIRYAFEGFISGNTYKIKGFAKTQNNVSIESPLYTFTVSYTSPVVNTNPTATLIKEKTAIQIDLGTITQLTGVATGTFSYVSDFITGGNYGLQLNSGATLSYSLDIPLGFSEPIIWQPLNSGFSGDIIEFTNSLTGDYFKFGFNGNQFYKNINNAIEYSLNKTLTTNYFLFVILFNKVYIREFNSITLQQVDLIIL